MHEVMQRALIAGAAMLVPATAAADVANACALLSPVEIQEITGRSDLATGKPDLRPWRK